MADAHCLRVTQTYRDRVAAGPCCGGREGQQCSGKDNRDAAAAAAATNAFAAVITIEGCEHIELRSFAVEAATGEVGILLDGTGKLGVAPPRNTPGVRAPADNIRAAGVANLGVV